MNAHHHICHCEEPKATKQSIARFGILAERLWFMVGQKLDCRVAPLLAMTIAEVR